MMKLKLEPVVIESEISFRLNDPHQALSTDPWKQESDPEKISGKKAANPWIGKFDRRTNSRDSETIAFNLH